MTFIFYTFVKTNTMWGTNFDYNVYLSRQEYKTHYEVMDAIAEKEEDIRLSKEKILMYASANPNDVVPVDWSEEKIRFIHSEITTLLDEITEDTTMLVKLNMYLDHLECKEKSSTND